MQDANVESSMLQLVIDQLEELTVTLIEEVRERPAVAVAILAALAGAVTGSILAARSNRRGRSPTSTVARRARGVGDAADLVGVMVRLLRNPIVRGLIFAAAERQLKRRLPL
jgi:hypothetical protein